MPQGAFWAGPTNHFQGTMVQVHKASRSNQAGRRRPAGDAGNCDRSIAKVNGKYASSLTFNENQHSMLVGPSFEQLRKVRRVGASIAINERSEGRRQDRQAGIAAVECAAMRTGLPGPGIRDLSLGYRVQAFPLSRLSESFRAGLRGQDVAGDAQRAHGNRRPAQGEH